MKLRDHMVPLAVCLATFVALHVIGLAVPSLVSRFAQAAAWLAATALGVPFVSGAEPIIAHPAHPLQIVASCSGWNFFCLLAALLSGRGMTRHNVWQRRLFLATLALPLAAAFTLLVNASRFVVVVQSGIHIQPHMPTVADASLHTAIGVVVFLPALMGAYVFWERRVCHA